MCDHSEVSSRRAAGNPRRAFPPTGKWLNRKKIHHSLKRYNRQPRVRPKGHRPRAKGWAARPEGPNRLWQIDATHLFTRNGWCHLVSIIDTWDRSIVGRKVPQSSSASVAMAALKDALRARRIDPRSSRLTLRSDNGLVFGAKSLTRLSKSYNEIQEYITPYTPEQNGMIERFFRTAKDKLFWQHNLANTDEAFRRFADWLDHYHDDRPHPALGYQTTSEFRRRSVA